MQPFLLQIYTRQDLIEKTPLSIWFPKYESSWKKKKTAVTFLNISHLTGKIFFNVKCSGLLVFTNETVWVTGIAFVTSPGLTCSNLLLFIPWAYSVHTQGPG